MERVEVTCPNCGVKLRLPAGKLGTVACPKCRAPFRADTRRAPPSGGEDDPADLRWRDELIKSLNDVGVTRPPLPSRWRAIGTAILLSPLVIIALLIRSVLDQNPDSPVLVYSGTLLTLIATLLVGTLRLPLSRLWRQTRAQRAQAAIAGARKRPILYLRSFDVDAQVGRRSLAQLVISGLSNVYVPPTAEESLARHFGKLGPVIAIGRPGEDMPALGAARFYVSHDRWQQKVADVVRVSQLVIWVSGVTEGLGWELSHLIKWLPPTKLVLWAHPHLLKLDAAQREAEWRAFIDRLGNLFPKPLPRTLGDIRFFYFGPDFEPHPVRGNEYALVSSQGDAMKSLLRAKGLGESKSKPPAAWTFRSPSRRGQLLSGVGASLLMSVLPGIWSLGYSILHGLASEFSLASFVAFVLNCIISVVWVGLFVLAQPLMIRSRAGYWGGALLFALLRNAVDLAVIAPLGWLLFGDASMLESHYVVRYFVLIPLQLLPLRLFDALGLLAWMLPVMLLLRFLPYAAGRPVRPDSV